mmetsp:Transcript_16693/g.27260  ORF Transcript_16693/g.27260 Transcript_16693/m.27260 type:complete len:438 (-) Transcript_16693:143-1456(-)
MSDAAKKSGDGQGGRWQGGMNKGNCTCTKTQCLKLYCECFSGGKYCNDDCVCASCHNSLEHDMEGGARYEAISYILFRKPDAFDEETRKRITPKDKTKVGGTKSGDKIPNSAGKTKGKPGRPRKNANQARIELVASKHEAIEFSTDEYPQLALDEHGDYTELAGAFTKPLFEEPSRPLEIAYSQRTQMDYQTRIAQQKKIDLAKECRQLREKLQEKKLALSLASDEIKECNKKLGTWTRKVFELELEEPCEWNTNYQKLSAFKQRHGKMPSKKSQDEEEKSLSAWLDNVRHEKNTGDDDEKKGSKAKRSIDDYPHRLQSLELLGISMGRRRDDTFEAMLQKLVEYKEEHGTLRFPSDELCEKSKNLELQALQKWVKSQVLNFRSRKMSPDAIRQLTEVGFSFEKWCLSKPKRAAKKKGSPKQEETPESTDITENAVV